ncbi:MAG TPA: hypothetical protein VFM34_12740 [Moraxellaceae bacterium]|nr:hypothetical protein [Moraxellaceae bacterium]
MKLRIAAIASLMILAGQAYAEMVVVANPQVAGNSIPRSELRRLFLGQSAKFANGAPAVPIDATGDHRNAFYQGILRKQPEQVANYWARMIFTGKATPPQQVNPKDIKSTVATTPGAVSYLDSTQVDGSVKVMSVVDDTP